MKKLVPATSVKPGGFIVIDDAACKIVSAEVSKSGKHGHAKVRIVAIGLLDDKKRDIVMPGHENVEVPIIEKRSAQVLNVVGETANAMDEESFETFDLKIPEELKDKAVPNAKVVYWIILGQKVMKQLKGAAEEQR